jgi:hypothetical protein
VTKRAGDIDSFTTVAGNGPINPSRTFNGSMAMKGRAKRAWTSAKSVARKVETDSKSVGRKAKKTALRVGRATERGAGRVERTVLRAGRSSKVAVRKLVRRRNASN